MIIVKLMGGLGNQMFQYAFGRNIALKNKCDLKLDLSFFRTNESRKYSLNHFLIIENIAETVEIESLKHRHFLGVNKIKRKLFNARPYFIHQKNLEFNTNYLKTQTDVYLDGYWQSEKFFIDSAAQIRKDFQIKTLPSPTNENVLLQIESTNAVSLHIRRGDFQTSEALNKIHGTCSLEYYHRAAELIADKALTPIFYVFSDDISWAKKHLKLSYEMHFVDINDEQSAYEDLRLMSACKHHVLANSSFSWWGAWLNHKAGKITVAPKTWFVDIALNQQSSSIIPDNWIRI
jgi:hypothetical protein